MAVRETPAKRFTGETWYVGSNPTPSAKRP